MTEVRGLPAHWCRQCHRFTRQAGSTWIADGPVATKFQAVITAKSEGRELAVAVCSLCYQRARLNDGVDLSNPSTVETP